MNSSDEWIEALVEHQVISSDEESDGEDEIQETPLLYSPKDHNTEMESQA